MATTASGRAPTSRSTGSERTQQAIRFNVFQLAQAARPRRPAGVPAKGVTGSGYEGHYFWDTEVYVVPFLSYTLPHVARNLLHFRHRMLPTARERAREMAQSGALFPWRTINGEEASAYYAAGTAAVHINADIAYALMQYVAAPATRASWSATASTCWSRPRGCGPTSASGAPTASAPSTSTASPAPTSTRPSSTTTCSPT